NPYFKFLPTRPAADYPLPGVLRTFESPLSNNNAMSTEKINILKKTTAPLLRDNVQRSLGAGGGRLQARCRLFD
ncbi:MAG: hypothetical protein ACXVH6_04730, partial [Halobacteriota archaeon]